MTTEQSLPKFVRIGKIKNDPHYHATALRLVGNLYHCDAGCWEIGYKWVDGELFIDDVDNHFKDDNKLYEIDEVEWREWTGRFAPANIDDESNNIGHW